VTSFSSTKHKEKLRTRQDLPKIVTTAPKIVATVPEIVITVSEIKLIPSVSTSHAFFLSYFIHGVVP
jgi:hypothetical protein